MSKAMKLLKEDLKRDERVLEVKRKIVEELGQLADDKARRRVIRMVMAYYGYAVPAEQTCAGVGAKG